MKFLIDAQLPPAFARWIESRGHEARHVVDIGLGAASDEAIATLAVEEELILISKDEDFLTIRLPDRFALLWLRCGNCTNRALGAFMEKRWDQIVRLLEDGERMIEVI